MSERRGLKRFPTSLRVWCESDDLTVMLQASNVSRGGMFLKTSNPPPPDQEMKVSIEELSLVAMARVCWTHRESGNPRSGMGLELTQIEQGLENYERYVENCSSHSGEHALGLPVSDSDDPPDRG